MENEMQINFVTYIFGYILLLESVKSLNEYHDFDPVIKDFKNSERALNRDIKHNLKKRSVIDKSLWLNLQNYLPYRSLLKNNYLNNLAPLRRSNTKKVENIDEKPGLYKKWKRDNIINSIPSRHNWKVEGYPKSDNSRPINKQKEILVPTNRHNGLQYENRYYFRPPYFPSLDNRNPDYVDTRYYKKPTENLDNRNVNRPILYYKQLTKSSEGNDPSLNVYRYENQPLNDKNYHQGDIIYKKIVYPRNKISKKEIRYEEGDFGENQLRDDDFDMNIPRDETMLSKDGEAEYKSENDTETKFVLSSGQSSVMLDIPTSTQADNAQEGLKAETPLGSEPDLNKSTEESKKNLTHDYNVVVKVGTHDHLSTVNPLDKFKLKESDHSSSSNPLDHFKMEDFEHHSSTSRPLVESEDHSNKINPLEGLEHHSCSKIMIGKLEEDSSSTVNPLDKFTLKESDHSSSSNPLDHFKMEDFKHHLCTSRPLVESEVHSSTTNILNELKKNDDLSSTVNSVADTLTTAFQITTATEASSSELIEYTKPYYNSAIVNLDSTPNLNIVLSLKDLIETHFETVQIGNITFEKLNVGGLELYKPETQILTVMAGLTSSDSKVDSSDGSTETIFSTSVSSKDKVIPSSTGKEENVTVVSAGDEEKVTIFASSEEIAATVPTVKEENVTFVSSEENAATVPTLIEEKETISASSEEKVTLLEGSEGFTTTTHDNDNIVTFPEVTDETVVKFSVGDKEEVVTLSANGEEKLIMNVGNNDESIEVDTDFTQNNKSKAILAVLPGVIVEIKENSNTANENLGNEGGVSTATEEENSTTTPSHKKRSIKLNRKKVSKRSRRWKKHRKRHSKLPRRSHIKRQSAYNPWSEIITITPETTSLDYISLNMVLKYTKSHHLPCKGDLKKKVLVDVLIDKDKNKFVTEDCLKLETTEEQFEENTVTEGNTHILSWSINAPGVASHLSGIEFIQLNQNGAHVSDETIPTEYNVDQVTEETEPLNSSEDLDTCSRNAVSSHYTTEHLSSSNHVSIPNPDRESTTTGNIEKEILSPIHVTSQISTISNENTNGPLQHQQFENHEVEEGNCGLTPKMYQESFIHTTEKSLEHTIYEINTHILTSNTSYENTVLTQSESTLEKPTEQPVAEHVNTNMYPLGSQRVDHTCLINLVLTTPHKHIETEDNRALTSSTANENTVPTQEESTLQTNFGDTVEEHSRKDVPRPNQCTTRIKVNHEENMNGDFEHHGVSHTPEVTDTQHQASEDHHEKNFTETSEELPPFHDLLSDTNETSQIQHTIHEGGETLPESTEHAPRKIIHVDVEFDQKNEISSGNHEEKTTEASEHHDTVEGSGSTNDMQHTEKETVTSTSETSPETTKEVKEDKTHEGIETTAEAIASSISEHETNPAVHSEMQVEEHTTGATESTEAINSYEHEVPNESIDNVTHFTTTVASKKNIEHVIHAEIVIPHSSTESYIETIENTSHEVIETTAEHTESQESSIDKNLMNHEHETSTIERNESVEGKYKEIVSSTSGQHEEHDKWFEHNVTEPIENTVEHTESQESNIDKNHMNHEHETSTIERNESVEGKYKEIVTSTSGQHEGHDKSFENNVADAIENTSHEVMETTAEHTESQGSSMDKNYMNHEHETSTIEWNESVEGKYEEIVTSTSGQHEGHDKWFENNVTNQISPPTEMNKESAQQYSKKGFKKKQKKKKTKAEFQPILGQFMLPNQVISQVTPNSMNDDFFKHHFRLMNSMALKDRLPYEPRGLPNDLNMWHMQGAHFNPVTLIRTRTVIVTEKYLVEGPGQYRKISSSKKKKKERRPKRTNLKHQRARVKYDINNQNDSKNKIGSKPLVKTDSIPPISERKFDQILNEKLLLVPLIKNKNLKKIYKRTKVRRQLRPSRKTELYFGKNRQRRRLSSLDTDTDCTESIDTNTPEERHKDHESSQVSFKPGCEDQINREDEPTTRLSTTERKRPAFSPRLGIQDLKNIVKLVDRVEETMSREKEIQERSNRREATTEKKHTTEPIAYTTSVKTVLAALGAQDLLLVVSVALICKKIYSKLARNKGNHSETEDDLESYYKKKLKKLKCQGLNQLRKMWEKKCQQVEEGAEETDDTDKSPHGPPKTKLKKTWQSVKKKFQHSTRKDSERDVEAKSEHDDVSDEPT